MRANNFTSDVEFITDVITALLKRVSCPCGSECPCSLGKTESPEGAPEKQDNSNNEPAIMTTEEVAAIFSMRPSTIHRWCRETRQGKNDFPLPSKKPGQRNYWTRESINEYLLKKEGAKR